MKFFNVGAWSEWDDIFDILDMLNYRGILGIAIKNRFFLICTYALLIIIGILALIGLITVITWIIRHKRQRR